MLILYMKSLLILFDISIIFVDYSNLIYIYHDAPCFEAYIRVLQLSLRLRRLEIKSTRILATKQAALWEILKWSIQMHLKCAFDDFQ